MKPQSKSLSLIESLTNVAISFWFAVAIGSIIYPWFGLEIDLFKNMQITAIFMVASIIRGYLIRRWFNWIGSQR